jgi:dihydroxyacetone kinase-like predicted kinase
MHIHVPDSRQDEPVALIQTLGKVSKFAVENLMEQRAAQGVSASSGLKLAQVDARQIGAVAVAPGIGIARVLASLGVAAIVEGGQTMNPSTQEILGAVESLPTDKVIILPNNKNIVLAAKQAADLTAKRLVVVPSVSVPQGIAALLAFDPEGDLVTVSQAMTAALQDVQTAELTVATRSVEVDGVEVHEGQAIGLLNGRLAVSGDSLEEALMGALERAGMDKAELVTLYYGAELPRPEADRLAGLIRQRWHGVEVEVHSGGQPHYQLILSIE